MTEAKLFRLVLLVSCAHALVHVYEFSFPSVEQLIAFEMGFTKETSGALANCFRLPFGLLAILVGWLVDKYGAKIMLSMYLIGCGAMAALVSVTTSLPVMFMVMFTMGCFASMYHPAGLALISHETTLANRPRALGLHGIFGSLGIASAPFLAMTALALGVTWRGYYGLLTIPGVALGLWFALRFHSENHASGANSTHPDASADDSNYGSFFVLTLFGMCSGFLYAAFLTFLPRYLDGAKLSLFADSPGANRNFLAGCALIVGIVGQYTAGRIARPGHLEPLLAAIMAANAPFLLAMGLAEGNARIWVTGGFALVHFMNQPIYNSLIASYAPRRRRSLCYGFSFLMTFGLGSFGASVAGYAGILFPNPIYYAGLAGLALVASGICLVLWRWNRVG